MKELFRDGKNKEMMVYVCESEKKYTGEREWGREEEKNESRVLIYDLKQE